MNKIIEVKNLTKKYGDFTAVDDISFFVESQEIFGILGPNGAGKTTTLEMIEGLRKIDSGEVTVAGINVSEDINKVKSMIGVQLQASSFFEYLTLEELLIFFGNLYEREVNSDELLKEVELLDKKNLTLIHYQEAKNKDFQLLQLLLMILKRFFWTNRQPVWTHRREGIFGN